MPGNEQTTNGNPAQIAQLLQQLGDGGDSDALMQTLLGSATMTPQASMLADWLRNNADDLVGDDPDDNDAEIERLLAIAENEQFDAGQADTETDADSEELETLREVNDTVAAALGACPSCWGGADECPTCGGNGAAGSMDMNEALFTELVMPAVRRYRLNRQAKSSDSPDTE